MSANTPAPRKPAGRARDWSEGQIAELATIAPSDLLYAEEAARDAVARSGAAGNLADAVEVDADGNPLELA